MDKKIYRVRQITWMIPIAIFALLAFSVGNGILFTIQTITHYDPSAILPLLSGYLLTGFCAYIALFFFDIPATRLELSDEGVFFYGSGYRLYTPWSNISSIIWTTRSPRFPGVFELKEAAVTTLSLEEGRRNNQAILETHWRFPVQLFQNKAMFFCIPVPVRWLPKKARGDGILDDYLQHYAPHLKISV